MGYFLMGYLIPYVVIIVCDMRTLLQEIFCTPQGCS